MCLLKYRDFILIIVHFSIRFCKIKTDLSKEHSLKDLYIELWESQIFLNVKKIKIQIMMYVTVMYCFQLFIHKLVENLFLL